MGLIGALAIHAAVVAAALFTWQHRLDIAEESPPMVPVDLVTIGPKTNIMAAAPKITPQEPTPQIQPDKLILPTPAVPEEQAEAAPPDQAASEPSIKAPPPPIAPKFRPQQQPDAKKSTFNVDNIAALLNKVAPAATQPPSARTVGRTHKGLGDQSAMNMELRDALKNQIEQCWSPPAGAPHPEQLIVAMDLSLNPDGSVARPPQLTAQSGAEAAGNPFMRAAADAALRAIYVCAPYKLPADRYADWRDSTVQFDPRDLVGQ